MAQDHDPFENHHKFQDDVWGQIRLNDLERDVIDTPEFQRLFRTSQLGFVELVYHTANHTRGAHSIGACRMTNRLINRLVDNTKDLHDKYHDEPGCEGLYADFEISAAERILIRLGALLHDISHVPLSHDLEKKTHKVFYPSQERPMRLRSWYGHYDKHDDYEDNPLLYRLLCDYETSVLARVLQYYSKRFWKALQEDADKAKHHHLKEFADLVRQYRNNVIARIQPLSHALAESFRNLGNQTEADRFNLEVSDWQLLPDQKILQMGRRVRDLAQRILSEENEHQNSITADAITATTKALEAFTAWNPESQLLPQLIFHLLFYEKPDEAKKESREIATSFETAHVEKWHLGPKSLRSAEVKQWHEAWYQPFRHDIIGNTLSADLIDYLTRDPQRLGTQRRVDLHLLSYYALVNKNPQNARKQFRSAIDLHDHKRGTTRTFILNDLFRLLDLRQDIHEKAVVHRVVQSANAMLARGLLLLTKAGMPPQDKRPTLKELVGLGSGQHHALQSEDLFFQSLLVICDGKTERHFVEARRIFEKLTERRVYRPLVIIPGDWANDKLGLHQLPPGNDDFRDFPLRTLATIVDSAYYSSFLLFACGCMEKYVEGVFDTAKDLWNYTDKIAAADASDQFLEQARRLIPSRIITWTAPYKQLYKDPAIVVALGKCVEQIDEIAKPSFRGRSNLDSSTHERIRTAIADADSKYATLWQLYVFISDGLFYTGILNKLLNHALAASERSRDDHLTRLQNAQAFLALAFKTVCEFWAGTDHRHPTTEQKEVVLKEQMDAEGFRQVVDSWTAKCKARKSWPEKWGTVDVKQYYHEFSLDETVPEEKKRPCRDSRYKFDRPSGDVWTAAGNDPTSDGFKLIQFLSACHIADPNLLSEGEFKQLVELYKDEATQRRCDDLAAKAASDQAFIPEALKSLWLSGFPLPQPDETPLQPDVFQMPASRSGIRDWVYTEIERLNPNVVSRIEKDIEPIIDVLDWAGKIHGRAVYDDFHLRVRNERSLLWNDVRVERTVTTLKRKWNHPDVAEAGGD